MLAQLTSAVINYSMAAPKKPVKTADFMPSQWAQHQRERARSRKAIAEECRDVMEALMKRNQHA